MIERLQQLMNQYDKDIKIELTEVQYSYNLIAHYHDHTFSLNMTRKHIQDLIVYGFSHEIIYMNNIKNLYGIVKVSKIYLRTKKIERLLDEI